MHLEVVVLQLIDVCVDIDRYGSSVRVMSNRVLRTELRHSFEDVHLDIVDERQKRLRSLVVSLAKRVNVPLGEFHRVIATSL